MDTKLATNKINYVRSSCPHNVFLNFAGFRAAPISAVMESAGEAKVFSDLVQDQSTAEASFGQFLDGDAREQGGIFVHAPSCNAAAGCACNFARLNCSEIAALAGAVQNGNADDSDDKVRMHISSKERSVLGSLSLFFGAVTTRHSVEANTPKPTSGIRIITTGDAGRCFWGPDGIWSRTTDFCVKAAMGFRALVARQAAAILRLRGLLAEQRAAMAIAAEAIGADAPGGAPPPARPARPRSPAAAAGASTAPRPPLPRRSRRPRRGLI